MTTNVEITEMPKESKGGIPIVHVSVSGALTRDRYEFLRKGLEKLIAKHGKIRIMLVPQKLEGMTRSARKDNLRFEAQHVAGIDRVAVACAMPEHIAVPESAILFTDVDTRLFPPGKMEEAYEWLNKS